MRGFFVFIIGFLIACAPAARSAETSAIKNRPGMSSPIQDHPTHYVFMENRLFRKSDSVSPELLTHHPRFKAANRYRRVNLLSKIAEYGKIQAGDKLVLDLFPDVSYTALVDRVSVNVLGVVSVRARISGNNADGYVLFSTRNGKTLGSIVVPERNESFSIVFEPDADSHFLIDVDSTKKNVIQSSPVLIPDRASGLRFGKNFESSSEFSIKGNGPDDPATIDVMVVYTPAAKSWADSQESGIENTITDAMEKAQLVNDNSGTGVTMRLVHAFLVNYTEAGSNNDLNRLTHPSDDYMDDVHAARDEYGADLVTLYTLTSDTGGLGWLLNSKSGDPGYAFCLVRIQQASWSYTHIHEMGHNMGLHHHKQQTVQPGPTVWSDWPQNTWSAGWRWTGNDNGKYCDVMTYTSGTYFEDGINHTEVAYFSSPLVNFQGVATGDATDGDNARTIREIKHVVAAYRETSSPTYSISGTVSGAISEGVTLSLTGSSSNTKISGSDGKYSFSGLSNGSYTVTPSLEGYTFSPGSISVAISDANQSNHDFTATSEGGGDPEVPTVSTGEATDVTASAAMLNGTVNPNGDATEVWFEYGFDDEYGSTTAKVDAGSGTDDVPAEKTLSGLIANTTYYFRVVAENSAGIVTGEGRTFTTSGGGGTPPAVITGEATDVTASSAKLNGTVNPNGLSTTYRFEYGPTTDYGTNTSWASAGNGSSPVVVATDISGLAEGTTYHYRLVGINASGTVNGEDETFTAEADGGGGGGTPTIGVSKSSISVTVEEGQNPGSQTFSISNTGEGTLNFSITDNASWLSCDPTDGSISVGTTTISVSFSTADLATGVHSALITITDPNASNNPRSVTVNLTVTSSGYSMTIGSTIEITAADFGVVALGKKPKVYADIAGKKRNLKALFYSSSSGTFGWVQKAPAGTYTLFGEAAKGTVGKISDNFKVMPPRIDAETSTWTGSNTIETSKGLFSDVRLNLEGTYFGLKKPKVYFVYEDPATGKTKRKSFKVTRLEMYNNNGFSMLRAEAKKIPDMASGTIHLENGIGSDSIGLEISNDSKKSGVTVVGRHLRRMRNK